MVAAIGALKGPLHGGANEKVMEILESAGSPERAEQWLRQSLERRERIMGFGHRVYKTGDVRAAILKPYARKAAEAAGAGSAGGAPSACGAGIFLDLPRPGWSAMASGVVDDASSISPKAPEGSF